MAPGAFVMPDYEDFEPLCHWKRGQKRDTLEISVAGFENDQLKVQLSDAGVVIISGERPLNETKAKWSRFKKEIRPSRYCKKDEIQAKLSGEVLHIIMPKIKIQEQSKLLPENQETERNRPKTTQENKINKKMARNVALAVSILVAFVIYKYCQPSYVNDK